MKKPIALQLAIVAVIALAACSADDADTAANSAEERITFKPVEIGTRSNTRATQATTATITSYSVSCSVYGSSESYTSATIGSYFYNLPVGSTGETAYYWPGERYTVSFFAFYPSSNDNITISDAKTVGRPTYTYTVPEKISEQVDFMTAEVTDISGKPSSSDGKQELQFAHRCADIRLQVHMEGTSVIVHSITLFGLKYSGTFSNDTWTLTGEANSLDEHRFKISDIDKAVPAGETVDMTGTDNHLIMLPQTLEKGTGFIHIDAAIAGYGKQYTYYLPSDFTLEMGKSYNMTINLTPDYITVDTSSDITDWEEEPVYINSGNVIGVADWQQ